MSARAMRSAIHVPCMTRFARRVGNLVFVVRVAKPTERVHEEFFDVLVSFRLLPTTKHLKIHRNDGGDCQLGARVVHGKTKTVPSFRIP